MNFQPSEPDDDSYLNSQRRRLAQPSDFGFGSGFPGEYKSLLPTPSLMEPSAFQQPTYRSLDGIPSTRPALAPNLHDDAFSKPTGLPFDAGMAEKNAFSQISLLSTKTYGLSVEKSFSVDNFKSIPFGSEVVSEHRQTTDEVSTKMPPIALGGYLEPLCSFISTMHPKDIMNGLEAVLQSKSVNSTSSHAGEDFHIDIVKQLDFQLHCKVNARTGGASCLLVVQVFSFEDRPGRYGVEFQRRRGDGGLFCKMYQACIADVVQQGLVESSYSYEEEAGSRNVDDMSALFEELRLRSTMTAPELDTSDLEFLRLSMEQESSHTKDEVVLLRQMMGSYNTDSQLEGVKALVDMTCDPKCEPKAMLEAGAIECFVTASQSTNQSIVRCGLSGMANLMDRTEEATKRVLACDAVEDIRRYCSSKEADLQREAYRVYQMLCDYGAT